MTRFRSGSTLSLGAFVAVLGVIFLAALGWVFNIVKLFGIAQAADPNYVMAVLRAVGIIIAPLGAVLGFL